MSERARPIQLLIAEDDDDDFKLMQDAFEESRVRNPVRRVRDGEELMDYLLRRGAYLDPATSPEPGVILLDLNMPRMDGREALREIKSHPGLRHYPVVVLTTSKSEEDIVRSYQLGVNSFIRKPADFTRLVFALGVFERYWFEIVELPKG